MPVRTSYLLGAALLFVLAEIGRAIAHTPGEVFREKMEGLKAYCANRVLSPGEATCAPLSFKPADPLATPEGRLAHAIKLPSTVPERTYHPGMNEEAYFNELCKEAGEFIFSTAENVEGVMQLRPRNLAGDQMLQHLYALEDPYGYRDWEARNPESFYVGPESYRFLERPNDINRRTGEVVRYYGFDGRDRKTMRKQVAPVAQSRYGFLWRGIRRPNDREMGIAGGELIVLDINTLQVLAVKRGFARTGDDSPHSLGIWWRKATVCKADRHDLFGPGLFVTKVLIPAQR